MDQLSVQMLNGIRGTWREKHLHVIIAFLQALNVRTASYILKGGTALMLCYGLTRFSEDIDLDDASCEILQEVLTKFCESNNYEYRVAKNTDDVFRAFINYDNFTEKGPKPLKIEASFRYRSKAASNFETINGITVYDINKLARLKANAYSARDKLRDLFDVSFIINNYFDILYDFVIDDVSDSLFRKGLEQFDYLVEDQHDDLIDANKLEEEFLLAWDKLELNNSRLSWCRANAPESLQRCSDSELLSAMASAWRSHVKGEL